jgi:hypothetical protein
MADSAVAITAGAGTNIDTRTEGTNSNHRQVIVIGDPATNAGVAPVDATAGLKVDLGADNDVVVTNAGTFAVQATIAAAATSIGKAEDAAHASGDVGVPAMTVRQDTAAALSGTDADYQPLITDASGRLHVNVGNTVTVGSHAVTNAGTFAVQVDGAALTSLQLIDDAISGTEMQVDVVAALPAGNNNIGDVDVASVVPGTGATNLGKAVDTATGATDTGVLALATRDDALSALTPIEGDNVQLRVDANGALWAAINNTVTVASHAVTNAGTFAVQVDAAIPAGTNNIGDVDVATIAAGDNNIGNVDIVTVPAPLSTTGGGTEATALRVTLASDSTGLVSVDDNGASLTVDNGGTFAVQNTPAQVSTATVTALASAATSAQLLASTAGRRGLLLTNTDANGVYVKYGTTASATSFSVFIPGGDTTNGFGYWEMPAPIYTGRIDAIWAADGSGSLIATELT